MAVRPFLLVGLALVALAGPASAQTSAAGRATLTIPDVLRLMTVEVTGAGGAEEMVRLDVLANRRWELVVVLEDGSGTSWSAGAVAGGGPGRLPVELSYPRLLEISGAPPGSTARFTLTPL